MCLIKVTLQLLHLLSSKKSHLQLILTKIFGCPNCQKTVFCVSKWHAGRIAAKPLTPPSITQTTYNGRVSHSRRWRLLSAYRFLWEYTFSHNFQMFGAISRDLAFLFSRIRFLGGVFRSLLSISTSAIVCRNCPVAIHTLTNCRKCDQFSTVFLKLLANFMFLDVIYRLTKQCAPSEDPFLFYNTCRLNRLSEGWRFGCAPSLDSVILLLSMCIQVKAPRFLERVSAMMLSRS